jgi:hypothetical protein
MTKKMDRRDKLGRDDREKEKLWDSDEERAEM